MDVFAHLWRRLPDGPWTLQYRFRYYKDDQAHDSKDHKSGYHGTFDRSLDQSVVLPRVELALRTILEFMPEGFILDEIVVETDEPEAIARLLGEKKWLHLRIESVEPSP